MKQCVTWSISGIVAIALFAGGSIQLIASAQQGEDNDAIAQLLEVQNGRVAIKREQWLSYRIVPVGTQLDSGDLILPETGSVVTVLCDNGFRWRVPDGRPSGINNGCNSERADSPAAR